MTKGEYYSQQRAGICYIQGAGQQWAKTSYSTALVIIVWDLSYEKKLTLDSRWLNIFRQPTRRGYYSSQETAGICYIQGAGQQWAKTSCSTALVINVWDLSYEKKL